MNPENKNLNESPLESTVAPTQSTTEPSSVVGMAGEQKPRSNVKIYIAICVFVALVLVAAGGVFYARTANDNSNSNRTTPIAKNQQSDNKLPVTKPTQQPSKNSERMSDIDKAAGIISQYGNNEAIYPTLDQINDASFRRQNLPGLDDELLRDPSSAQSVYVSAPTQGAYSYEPLGSDGKACDNTPRTTVNASGPFACTQYKLTAILDDGSLYQKSGKSPEF